MACVPLGTKTSRRQGKGNRLGWESLRVHLLMSATLRDRERHVKTTRVYAYSCENRCGQQRRTKNTRTQIVLLRTNDKLIEELEDGRNSSLKTFLVGPFVSCCYLIRRNQALDRQIWTVKFKNWGFDRFQEFYVNFPGGWKNRKFRKTWSMWGSAVGEW